MLSGNYEVGSMGVGAGLCMYDVVIKKFTFAISSPGEFLVCFKRPSVARRPTASPTQQFTVTEKKLSRR